MKTKTKWKRWISIAIILFVPLSLLRSLGYGYDSWQYWVSMIGTVVGLWILEDSVRDKTLEERRLR